ncbi:MAG: helix-turn-helix transcriptional regulator [Acidimicrobiia bacterium]
MASRSRASIHRLIGEADHPPTIAELAAATGQHRTAVGLHLVELINAGLVEQITLPPAGRGRPAKRYRAVDDQPYRTLAGWLAEAVRTGRSTRQVGRSAGERLALRATDPVEFLLTEATRLGFAPVLEPNSLASLDPADGSASLDDSFDIVLRTCPFAALAAADPDTVCNLHLGLAEGVVRATGGAVVDGLQPQDPHLAGCRLRVRRADCAPDAQGLDVLPALDD